MDAKYTDLPAQRLGEAAQSEFTRSVDGVGGGADVGRLGAHVDNMTTASFNHVREHGAGSLDDTEEVDADLEVNVTQGVKVFEPLGAAKPSVVEQHIHLTVLSDDLRDHLVY